jgi:hypothetical protein
MTSDFTVAWQFSQREQLFVFVTDQTPRHPPKYCINLNGLGYILGDLFQQTHLVTLMEAEKKYRPGSSLKLVFFRFVLQHVTKNQ